MVYPPGPSARGSLPFLSNRKHSFAGVAQFLRETARRYGPISHWRVGPRHIYLLDDPPLIEELLVTRGRDFMKGIGAQRLKLVIGEGLVTSEPPLHLRQRRMMQPAFHRTRISGYERRMLEIARDRSAAWKNGDVLQIDAEMANITLDVVVSTMFGGATMRDTDDVRGALAQLQPGLAATMGPVTQFLSTGTIEALLQIFSGVPSLRRFLDGRKRLESIVDRLIAERAGSPDRGDLLSMLLSARDESGAPMSPRQVRDEALTIFLAGHETTAVALTWTLYLVALHPDVERRLYEELDTDYVRDVVAESMRLYPPVWNVVRRALRDTRLGTFKIPKGSAVMASPFVTHRNPALWEEAESFRPERWAGLREGLARFAYFPFGGGNRICIGEGFAWTEAIAVLRTILRAWQFEMIDRSPIGVNPMVTLRPSRPVMMRVRARTS